MKQLLFFILILLIPLLYLSGCSKDYDNDPLAIKKYSSEDIEKIVFTKCTGKEKIITNNKDISKIISYINSIEYRETKKDNPDNWAYYIKIINNDNTQAEVKFVINKIEFNNNWYKGNAYIINDLDKLYKTLNYPEEDF